MNKTAPRLSKSVEVAAVGHTRAGMTTLTAAILAVQAKQKKAQVTSYAKLVAAPEGAAFVGYDSNKCSYSHHDFVTSRDCNRSLITGAVQVNGVIVVVDVVQPILPSAQLALLAQLQVPGLVVFLNKCDGAGEQRIAEVEQQVREELERHQRSGTKTHIVRGAALPALNGDARWEKSITQLIETLDDDIPEWSRASDKPFQMTIAENGTVRLGATNLGCAWCRGSIQRGELKVGDTVEIVGFDPTRNVVIKEIRMRENVEKASAGDTVRCVLGGIDAAAVQIGQVLAAPGAIRPYRKIEGVVYAPSRAEGGGRAPIPNHARPSFYVNLWTVQCTVHLPEGVQQLSLGDYSAMTLELAWPMALERGRRFVLQDRNQPIGQGFVTKLLE